MSDIIINNLEIIFTLAFVLIILLVIVAIWRIGALFKFFSQTKFHIVPTATTDPITRKRTFQLNVYNRHMNDLRISSLGYVYQKNNIDFYNKYLEDHGLKSTDKLIVLSRDFVTFKLVHSDLKHLISDINKGKLKIKPIYAYVTDTQGITSIVKATETKKVIQQIINDEQKEMKQSIKASKIADKNALNQINRQKRLEKKLLKKEKRAKIFFKLKNIFRKKSK